MKKLFLTLAIALLAFIGSNAQTNTVTPSLSVTNADSGKAFGGWELTLGGAGENVKNGSASVGLDVSVNQSV